MAQEKNYNGIKITVAKDYNEMSLLAAKNIIEKIKLKPNINLLIPAGSTPKGTYTILKKQPMDLFRKVKFFSMDEYCQDNKKLINEHNSVSFRRFMEEHLFNAMGPVKNYFPDEENIKKEGMYDKKIHRYGGIDLCLNTLGIDGHTFGFNFPGVSFDSKTRLVKINEKTRKINKEKTGHETPRYAITTGIKTGMESKEILFLVSGKQKADILNKVIYSKPTPKIPATILKFHPKCKWIIDRETSSKLK